MIVATIILIILLLICSQYIATKYQMSLYDFHNYACTDMSHDAEQFFEGELGLRTVQRRVEAEHRWIAVEILPGVYIEYESTLRLFGMHLVTKDMVGKPIYQSEGFWENGEQVVTVGSSMEIHLDLNDWKEIGKEVGPSNEEFWKNFP